MPHEFKDISGIKGVATGRGAAEQDIHLTKERLWGSENGDHKRFIDPSVSVNAMGIEPGMKVADFGAGSGAYALAAARVVGRSGKVYAVDIQKDLLTRIKNNAAKERLDCLEIIWGNFEAPGGSRLKDASVDMVILSNVLFQVDHVQATLTEAGRVLKRNGRLVIVDWTDSFSGMGPEPKRVIKKEKMLAHVKEAGFALVREFPAGARHYGVILKVNSPAGSS